MAIALVVAIDAPAGTIRVGPEERVRTIAEAARIAKDDDVVEISAGDFRGDVAVWTQKRLTIRGTGKRTVLHASGMSAESKAIWVIRNGEFTVSNIEFRGARVTAANGAGIRFERGKLTVADCVFVDNQIGILTANFPDAELVINNSVFAEAPAHDTALPHLLYVGRIALLRVTGSRFHAGRRGHLLKSRARITEVRYNVLADGPAGSTSYEADFPDGGDVTLVGNVIAQSPNSENRTLIAYGAEGNPWPVNRLRLVHNTLVSEGLLPARFLHVFLDNFATRPAILTRNNLLAGTGPMGEFSAAPLQGNRLVPLAALRDPAAMDFTLLDRSTMVDAINDKDGPTQFLQPQQEHLQSGRLIPIVGLTLWVPGALQSARTSRH